MLDRDDGLGIDDAPSAMPASPVAHQHVVTAGDSGARRIENGNSHSIFGKSETKDAFPR